MYQVLEFYLYQFLKYFVSGLFFQPVYRNELKVHGFFHRLFNSYFTLYTNTEILYTFTQNSDVDFIELQVQYTECRCVLGALGCGSPLIYPRQYSVVETGDINWYQLQPHLTKHKNIDHLIGIAQPANPQPGIFTMFFCYLTNLCFDIFTIYGSVRFNNVHFYIFHRVHSK